MFDHTLPDTAVIKCEGLYFTLRRCHSRGGEKKQRSSAADIMGDEHLCGAPRDGS